MPSLSEKGVLVAGATCTWTRTRRSSSLARRVVELTTKGGELEEEELGSAMA